MFFSKKPQATNRNRKPGLSFDSLEGRDLMAASLTGGLLRVDPNHVDNTISVRQQSSNYVVELNGVNTSFPVSKVSKLEIHGYWGNDTITNSTSLPMVAYGEGGRDTIYGGEGNDVIYGGDGNDVIDGRGGFNIIDGNAGDDRIYGGKGVDYLYGSYGVDVIYGGAGDDYINGGDDGDVIMGDAGADYLDGADGNDSIYGGTDNDTIFGGAGVDTIYGQAGADTIYGQDGSDMIDGGTHADRIFGGNDADTLYGQAGDDVIDGGNGDDRIYGGSEYDYLYGSNGNDYIDAGQGGAYIHGGEGYDMEASKWAPAGAQSNDPLQLASPTCWFLSSLSSAAKSGADLTSANRIRLIGTGSYEVKLFDDSSRQWKWIQVDFDGKMHGADVGLMWTADMANDNQQCEGQFWTVLYERAMVKMSGVDYKDPVKVGAMGFGYADRGLTMVTGAQSTWWEVNNNNFDSLRMAVQQNKPTVVSTKSDATSLVKSHAYSVWSVDPATKNVTLRNPWAVNGGLITVSWATFVGSVSHVSTTL